MHKMDKARGESVSIGLKMQGISDIRPSAQGRKRRRGNKGNEERLIVTLQGIICEIRYRDIHTVTLQSKVVQVKWKL